MEATMPEALANHEPPAVQPARRFSPLVAMWGVLGAISLIYLGLLIARPEVLSTYLPAVAPVGAPESNEGQRANAIAATQDLRDKVNELEIQVEALRNDIASKTDTLSLKTVALDDRLTAVETSRIAAAPATKVVSGKTVAIGDAAATPPVSLLAPQAKPAAPVKKAAAAPVAKPAATAETAANPAAALAPPFPSNDQIPGVKLLNSIPPPAAAKENPAAALAPPLVTGSVEQPNLPAQVAKIAKPVGIYIGSGPSLESVRSSWSTLSSTNPGTLGGLQPRYTSSMDAEGMNYGLIAGPLKSTAEAQKVCKDLAAKAVNCRIGEYGGEAL